MADDELAIEPTHTKRPEDVVNAQRLGNAQSATFNVYATRAALRAIELLQEHRPDAPQATGPERQARATAVETAERHAAAAMELAGVDEVELPWRQWVTEFENRVAGAESRYLQDADQAENPEAFGVDATQAALTADNAACEVMALREILAELEAKAPTPNRAARRAAGKRGRTTPPQTPPQD